MKPCPMDVPIDIQYNKDNPSLAYAVINNQPSKQTARSHRRPENQAGGDDTHLATRTLFNSCIYARINCRET